MATTESPEWTPLPRITATCRELSLGLKQSKIVCFIGGHYPQGCGTFAHKISANFAHAIFDDVIVRYDVSRVADDEAGPVTLTNCVVGAAAGGSEAALAGC